MDWSRKHLVDLSGLCKACETDPALPVPQRQAFAEVYRFSKQCSSLPTGGGADKVATVIAQLCGVCQKAYSLECAGRTEWQHPCALLKRRTYQLTQ